MVSYADFITLLFAFFVVMYSISSVNTSKYKTFSESLEEALSNKEQTKEQLLPVREADPIQVGVVPTVIQPIELPHQVTAEERELSEEIIQERRRLDAVTEQFETALKPYVEEKLVGIKKHDFWVELEMNSELLFPSGSATLSPKAAPVLKKVAEVVKAVPNVINVEGHTDDKPIATGEFSSNWALSSARATSVVTDLVRNDIPPARLAAVGYGEFHPIADNAGPDGRFKNRRVVLLLISQAFARYGMSDEQRAKALNYAPQSNVLPAGDKAQKPGE